MGGTGNISLITFEYDNIDGTTITGTLVSDLVALPAPQKECNVSGHVMVG